MAAVTRKVSLPDYRVEVLLTLPDVLTSTEMSLLWMLIQGMGGGGDSPASLSQHKDSVISEVADIPEAEDT